MNNIGTQSASIEPHLISQYRHGYSLYFSGPQHTLLAHPPFATIKNVRASQLSEQVSHALVMAKELGFNQAKVMGAISFHDSKQSSLRLCPYVQEQPYTSYVDEPEDHPRLVNPTCELVPNQETFEQSVDRALHVMKNNTLKKVVLSRTLQIKASNAIETDVVLNRLQRSNPAGYTFAMNIPVADQQLATRTLIGASPELLVRKQGKTITVNPIAGSLPKYDDSEEDRKAGETLLTSEKDLYEHALVVNAIAKQLRPFCSVLDVPEKPELIHTKTLWHLSTMISGELAAESTSSLDIAMALHPTPAICGEPEVLAKKFIAENEGYERDLFTGLVGWCNAQGDGEWVITLRCAEVRDQQMTLYAGAGIVPGSCPKKEFDETGAKFNTLLDAIGLNRYEANS